VRPEDATGASPAADRALRPERVFEVRYDPSALRHETAEIVNKAAAAPLFDR